MNAILNVVLPVFGIMLAGYFCGRGKILGEASSEALNRYVYFVALPALFFISIARTPISAAIPLDFLWVYGGGALVTFLATFVLARFVFPDRLGVLGLHSLTGIFSNTGYMGIPLLALAFGADGRLPAVVASILNGAVVLTLGLVLIEIDLKSEQGFLKSAWRIVQVVLKSPLVLSALAGFGFSLLDIPIPEPFEVFCGLLADTAGPCALFAMGLFLFGKPLRQGLSESLWLTLVKLAVQPLVTWVLLVWFFPLESIWGASALILAALPTGTLVFVLSQQYGLFVQRATSVILISTVISIASLSLLFNLLGV